MYLFHKEKPEHSYNQMKAKPKLDSVKSSVLDLQDCPPTPTPLSSGLQRAQGTSLVLTQQCSQPVSGPGQLHAKVALSLGVLHGTHTPQCWSLYCNQAVPLPIASPGSLRGSNPVSTSLYKPFTPRAFTALSPVASPILS